jgi:hypothetical protein
MVHHVGLSVATDYPKSVTTLVGPPRLSSDERRQHPMLRVSTAIVIQYPTLPVPASDVAIIPSQFDLIVQDPVASIDVAHALNYQVFQQLLRPVSHVGHALELGPTQAVIASSFIVSTAIIPVDEPLSLQSNEHDDTSAVVDTTMQPLDPL